VGNATLYNSVEDGIVSEEPVTIYIQGINISIFVLPFPTMPVVSVLQMCSSLQHRHYSNPAAPNLQHTTNREQNDRCGNSKAQSQAPDDGYINVRNMLSI